MHSFVLVSRVSFQMSALPQKKDLVLGNGKKLMFIGSLVVRGVSTPDIDLYLPEAKYTELQSNPDVKIDNKEVFIITTPTDPNSAWCQSLEFHIDQTTRIVKSISSLRDSIRAKKSGHDAKTGTCIGCAMGPENEWLEQLRTLYYAPLDPTERPGILKAWCKDVIKREWPLVDMDQHFSVHEKQPPFTLHESEHRWMHKLTTGKAVAPKLDIDPKEKVKEKPTVTDVTRKEDEGDDPVE